MNWFRVPSWIGGRLCGDHVATDAEAWADLLGRWHQGEDVSLCAFQKATGWGKGRTLAFMPKVAKWALEAGATVPEAWSAKVADRPTDRNRTALRTGATEDKAANNDGTGPESDRPTDRNRTASCAHNSLAEREEIKKEREEKGGGAPQPEAVQPPKTTKDTTQPVIAAPGPNPAQEKASTIIHGTQATVVIPEPPVVESLLLSLLASSGMPMGQAASVARKLWEAGITSPTCEEAMVLDEFDLGRLVGPHKARVVVAFRKAGWLPPKERAQSARGGPVGLPGSPVVITETGERVEPTGPPGRPLTKSEKQVEALQALKRKGGEDGRAVGNR